MVSVVSEGGSGGRPHLSVRKPLHERRVGGIQPPQRCALCNPASTRRGVSSSHISMSEPTVSGAVTGESSALESFSSSSDASSLDPSH